MDGEFVVIKTGSVTAGLQEGETGSEQQGGRETGSSEEVKITVKTSRRGNVSVIRRGKRDITVPTRRNDECATARNTKKEMRRRHRTTGT